MAQGSGDYAKVSDDMIGGFCGAGVSPLSSLGWYICPSRWIIVTLDI
jgi:hypothetical protein